MELSGIWGGEVQDASSQGQDLDSEYWCEKRGVWGIKEAVGKEAGILQRERKHLERPWIHVINFVT